MWNTNMSMLQSLQNKYALRNNYVITTADPCIFVNTNGLIICNNFESTKLLTGGLPHYVSHQATNVFQQAMLIQTQAACAHPLTS